MGTRIFKTIFGAALLALAPLVGYAAEGTVTAALQSDMPSLDASVDSSPNGHNYRLNIYDQLTEIAADGSLAPKLATSWESSPDAVTWTFTIRQGVKFHDGSALTPDDIVWTFHKILADTKSPVRTYASKVKTVEVVAADKIRFTLVEPYSLFDRQLALIYILPRKAYEAMGATQFGITPVGSGPFKLVKWVKDDHIEMEAFDGYWGGAPKIKTAILRPIPAEPSRANALISGEIDIVPALPVTLVERLGSVKGIKVETAEGYREVFLGFNVEHSALANIKLRQAIDLAVDRNVITSKLLRGLGRPSGQMLSPASFGFDPSIKPTEQDVARAKRLVAESGYKGEMIPFQYPTTGLSSSNEVAQAVAGYLTAVGINTDMQGMDYNAFLAMWAQRKVTALYLFAFGSSILDADSTLTALYEKGSRGYWISDEVDALSRQQRAERDPEKRKAIIGKIWRLSQESAAFVPLYSEIQAQGLSERVNWTPRPDGILRFLYVTAGRK